MIRNFVKETGWDSSLKDIESGKVMISSKENRLTAAHRKKGSMRSHNL